MTDLAMGARLTSDAVQQLFRAQHGVASRAQLLALVHRDAPARAVARGALHRVHSGVYRAAAAPVTPEQRLMAATLAVEGGVASHRAAAWLHRLAGFEHLRVVEVSSASGARARGVRTHRMRTLDDADVCEVRGIPATRVERTLIDLCDVAPQQVAKALDAAIRAGVVTHARLDQLNAKRSSRTRGARVLSDLLRVRGPEDALAVSELESRFLQLLRRHSVRLPDHINRDFVEGGQFVARPDAWWDSPRLLVFLDGRAFHVERAVFEKDRAQANALAMRGWVVLRYTWDQVVEKEEAVAAELRSFLR